MFISSTSSRRENDARVECDLEDVDVGYGERRVGGRWWSVGRGVVLWPPPDELCRRWRFVLLISVFGPLRTVEAVWSMQLPPPHNVDEW